MAKALGTINPETFNGVNLNSRQVQVWPYTGVTDADTLQLSMTMLPTAVAWQPTDTTDQVAVTMSAAGLVTFSTSGVTTHAGNLLVFCGGAS